MAEQDAMTLEQLVKFERVACANDVRGIDGPPPCPAGEPPGTPVEAVRGGSCEGYWVTRQKLGEALAAFVDRPYYLYAVVRSQLAGRYHAVFASNGPDELPIRALDVTDSGIVGLYRGCSESARQLLAGAADFLAPPLR
jgi:hypothetical protein